jgi:VIT1/CCC1 family predicted Fe2+/Mn2+ transporter
VTTETPKGSPIRRRSFIDPHNIVYATIILMVSMGVAQFRFEENGDVSLTELIVLAVGPLIMVALAHSFAGAIEVQVREQRPLNAEDYRHLGVTVLQYGSVAVVPVILAIVLHLAGQATVVAADAAQTIGLLSLFLWGYYAGWASGRGHVGRLVNALLYGIVGLVIILLEFAVSH